MPGYNKILCVQSYLGDGGYWSPIGDSSILQGVSTSAEIFFSSHPVWCFTSYVDRCLRTCLHLPEFGLNFRQHGFLLSDCCDILSPVLHSVRPLLRQRQALCNKLDCSRYMCNLCLLYDKDTCIILNLHLLPNIKQNIESNLVLQVSIVYCNTAVDFHMYSSSYTTSLSQYKLDDTCSNNISVDVYEQLLKLLFSL